MNSGLSAEIPPGAVGGRRLLAAVLLLGLALRFGIAARDLRVVDRLFIPDDTYYTLSIARSLAEHGVPAADGIHPTSGFQPLLAFLVAPVFLVSGTPDLPIRFTLFLLCLADVGTALLLARLARRWFGDGAAVLAATCWSFSPIAIAIALGGLETSLALFLQLAAVASWARSRERSSVQNLVLTGVCCGLALLARIDSAFLVLAIGLFELVTLRIRRVSTIALAAAAIVAPWWLYCALHFGSVVPESGSAVVHLLESHRASHLTVPKQLAWATGTVLGSPFVDLRGLRRWLSGEPSAALLLTALLLGGTAWLTARLSTRSGDRGPLLAMAAHATTIFLFYSLSVPALWFFRRYLSVTAVLAVLLVTGVVSVPWRRLNDARRWQPLARGAVWLLIAAGALRSVSYLWHEPAGTVDRGLDGAKGYREVAEDVLALVPDGSTIAALQSGALSYFAPSGVAIVNLDGVVDGRAARAFRERRLSDYAFERGVTHIADWPLNLREFERRSSNSALARFEMRSKGESRPQGADRFLLGELSWTPTAPAGTESPRRTADHDP